MKDVISKNDIAKIKRIAHESGYSDASLMSDNRNGVFNEEIRKTGVAFSSDPYLYDLFCPMITHANDSSGWNFDIDWYESVQIATYKKDQYYSWHKDGGSDNNGVYTEKSAPVANDHYIGKVRKLSLVGILSDGYDGGVFQIRGYLGDGEKILEPDISIGDVVVFPSYLIHRSSIVTKGTKYSLSMWCLGPPFK